MRILMVRNDANDQAMAASLTLSAYLGSQAIDCVAINASELGNDEERAERRSLLEPPPDLLLVLGGDGTLLHAVHYIHPLRVPVLGINFGHLGFLTNGEAPGVLEIVSAALAGDVTRERRTCLSVEVQCAEVTDEEGAAAGPIAPGAYGVDERGLAGQRSFFAVNEIALTRGAMGRIIDYRFSVGGSPVAKLRGDGLVVATATGSTAYALSAGGPLVAPSHGGLVVVPLAAHSLQSRAIVTGPSDVVEVDLEDKGVFRDVTLFLDGEMLLFPSPVRRVVVSSQGDPIELLRYGSESFYAHVSEVFF